MSRTTGRRRPTSSLVGIRGLEQLEARATPDATLVSSTYDTRSAPLGTLLQAGDGPSEVLATNKTGNIVLIQSQATNLVQNQATPPLQTNLFVYTLLPDNTSTLQMVAPTSGGLTNPVDFGGVVPSVPGVRLNAVLSEDGSTVAFLSAANAGRLATDQLFANDLSRDGGGDDIFSYNRLTGQILLVSRDFNSQAIGGAHRVSNPAVSADGKFVSFVTTMPAGDVTGRNNVFIDNFRYPDSVTNNYFTTITPTVPDPDSPDLFVAQPGATPNPVSYDQSRDYDLTTATQYRYLMHGDIQVDPLGRYMTSGGVGFTAIRTRQSLVPTQFLTQINGGTFTFPGLIAEGQNSKFATDGLWKYAFTPSRAPVAAPAAVADAADAVDRNQILVGSIAPNVNIGTQLVRVASFTNATVARDSGQIMFDYTPVSSTFLPTITPFQFPRTSDVQNDDIFVPRATATNAATGVATAVAAELYRYDSSTNKFVMISAASQTPSAQSTFTTYTAGNGNVDLSPGNYGQSFNGTRVIFVSSSSDLVTPARATTLNPVAVPSTGKALGFTQVYQYDSQDVGRTDNSLATPGTQIARNPLRLLSYGFDQTPGIGYVFGNNNSRLPTQLEDSLAIAYESSATNLQVGNTDGRLITNGVNIYLWERTAPLGPPRLSLVSQAADNTLANGVSTGPPVISGAYNKLTVFFNTTATNQSESGFTPGLGQQVFSRDFPRFLTTSIRSTAVSGGNGTVIFGITDAQGNLVNTVTLRPFGNSWNGEVRVALADVNGDGEVDIIAGVGPGGGPRVAVLNGFIARTGGRVAVLKDFFAFEPRFLGGVYVAGADITGDGKADLIIGAGEGGGPRVQVVNGATDKIVIDRFVYETSFRGGARVSAGDVTGDGVIDLVTAAGIGGGPRVSVFDGLAIRAGALTNNASGTAYADFFAYEPNQRGGVYVSAGDYDGDSLRRADIVTGGGPDGGPRVTVFNAANIVLQDPNITLRFVDFFAFDSNNRTGARPVLKNINNDLTADLVVGTGGGFPLVRTFNGSSRVEDPNIASPLKTLNPFSTGITLAGAWVG